MFAGNLKLSKATWNFLTLPNLTDLHKWLYVHNFTIAVIILHVSFSAPHRQQVHGEGEVEHI